MTNRIEEIASRNTSLQDLNSQRWIDDGRTHSTESIARDKVIMEDVPFLLDAIGSYREYFLAGEEMAALTNMIGVSEEQWAASQTRWEAAHAACMRAEEDAA
jgi:hypothetical protein